MTSASPPRVDVVVPVYNEAPAIAAKVANLAALTYPADRLRVHVVDTDRLAVTGERWRYYQSVPLPLTPARL